MKTSNRLEDYSAEEIREEIERGARIVSYAWCVSLLIITFRRGTRPYLIKGGHSRLAPGLPWALLTLLLGWWGFPWGLVYTPAALWKTLRGGADLTDAWIDAYAAHAAAAQLAVRAAAGASSVPAAAAADGGNAAAFAPAAPASAAASPPAPAPASPEDLRRRRKRKLAGLGVALCIVAVFLGAANFMGSRSRVVIVNGLGAAYTVAVDGEPCPLAPFGRADLGRLANGAHTIRATLPGLPAQDFSVTIRTGRKGGFLKTGPLFVINPDRLALVCEERMKYGSKNLQDFVFKLHANAGVLELRAPDFVFKDFPETIRVKSGESRVRTRVGQLDTASAPLANLLSFIAENNGAAAAAAYLAQSRALGGGQGGDGAGAARNPPPDKSI
jgi:hypothetical protein